MSELTVEQEERVKSELKDFIQNYSPMTEQEEPRKKYREKLASITHDSEKRSLVVDYADLALELPEIANVFSSNPKKILQVFNMALRESLEAVSEDYLKASELRKYRVRIRGNIIPSVKVRDLFGNVGRFVSVRGRVKEVTDVKPKLTRAMFKCKSCSHEFPHSFYFGSFQKPRMCPANNCDNSRSFRMLVKGREFEEFQTFTLEGIDAEPTGPSNGELQDIDVVVMGDETGKVSPGDLVEVCGIVDVKPERKIRNGRNPLFDAFLWASFIEKQGTSRRKSNILEAVEDEKEFNFWLSNNIDLLKVTGMDLRAMDTEVTCGSNRLDILARIPQTGEKVIIESQLTMSDSNHLGKTLTYLLSVGARHAIWIASEFREKHQKVVNWLNSNTPISIYTLELCDHEKEGHLFKITSELGEKTRLGLDESPTGPTSKKRKRYTTVLDIVRKGKEEEKYHHGVPLEDIKREAEKEGIGGEFVEEILEREKKRGGVYEPAENYFAPVPDEV